METDVTLALLTLLYLGANLLAACAFAWDKRKATKDSWRTRENTLLVLAFLGPFGALGAMRMFRHKTRKIKFYFMPVFACLHAILIIWFLSGTIS